MKLGGLQKITLIDYPGKIVCAVFTIGCNFRCPFCHNPELVYPSMEKTGAILEKDFFIFLKNKKNKLDGVCITGGEPTIQPDIIKFIRKIKKMGFAVKLDTNGTRPDVINFLIKKRLVDYIAMDIKNSPEKYFKANGVKFDLKRIKYSVELIKNSGLDYEFRTTVVPGIHQYNDFKAIGIWLKDTQHYILQKYQDQGKILDEKKRPFYQKAKGLDLKKIKKELTGKIKKISIR